ncbi:hypothetical protein [Acetatifactor aquisgranensis]|uniref:hypothetical protein n=1 Tax=Acetatifactor aquisgranensis TaxID=2941233 RepID=UPI00203B7097|nr:hypothetical protein [Acetatifactor aquisgranensis]
MELEKIKIDPALLTYAAQALGRVPESLYDFQKIKNLSCGGRPVFQKLIDPLKDALPERLEIVRGDFSIIGKMSRLKKLAISAMPVKDFSFLTTCTALESLEISACGIIDCAFLGNLYSLKSLSLLNCSGLEHMEEILKLFRLERLSLEGSQISDISHVDCFLNCRIKEVRLPEHILKAKQAEMEKQAAADAKKAAARAKRTKRKSGPAVPFQPAERKQDQYPYTLHDFNSSLWESYRGAYGNIEDYIVILMGERDKAPETFKLRRLENVPKTNYELAFDNLCENLWHQMSFYPATWLALPYLARLMEGWEREKNLEWMFKGIMAAGSFLATDVYGDRPGEEDIYESYRNAGLQIRAMAIDFLAGNLDYVREKEVQWRREFAIAVAAILGEQKLAYMLSLSGFISYYIVCPECENCDEEIEVGYFELSERMKKAKAPSGKWDGRSLEDARLWLPNLLNLLEDEEGEELLADYFGTYVCPECGKKTPVLTGMEGYYFGE